MGDRIVRRLMLVLGGAMAIAGGSAAPAQAFEAQGPLTAGFTSVCAITEQNSISCWGDNNAGHTSGAGAASGAFRTVVTGWTHTCAIDAAASISCWGADNLAPAVSAPDTAPGAFTQVGVTDGTHDRANTCALDTAGSISCWGSDGHGQTSGPSNAPGTFKQLAVGFDDHVCAIDSADSISCWGSDVNSNGPGKVSLPSSASGTFKQVSAGLHHTCAIDAAGSITCWGGDFSGQASQPTAAAGTFKQVSAGSFHTCAIDSADSISCWGDDGRNEVTGPGTAPGTFKHVVTGYGFTCAIDAADSISCWGDNFQSPVTAPDTAPGVFRILTMPHAQTDAATSVGATGATLNASVNAQGVATTVKYEYGKTTSFGTVLGPFNTSGTTMTAQPGQAIAGLEPNTTYLYRVTARHGTNPQALGEVRAFTTGGGPSAPTVVTSDELEVIEREDPSDPFSFLIFFGLNGSVNARGQATAYTFEYGPTPSFGNITPVQNGGSSATDFAVRAELEELALLPTRTYYYRLVATNATGTTFGQTRLFTTGPSTKPVAITGAASGLTPTGATLNGTINPKGDGTSFTFEYGTSTSFGKITAVDRVPFEPAIDQAVSLPATGLTPGTTYVYRLVATNANGTTSGPVMSFTTPSSL